MGRAIGGFEADDTTLYVEPFVGWRGWTWNPSTKRLYSLNGHEWTPGEELHAECKVDNHPAPEVECNCGIFSMKNPEDLHRHISRGGKNVVVGTVKLWGNTIVGTHGYRAEYALIDSLYVPCSDAEQKKAELMKFMYDIEGIKTPTYLKTVMASDIEETYGVTVFRHDPREKVEVPEDWRF